MINHREEEKIIYVEFFIAFGEILGALCFGYFYNKHGWWFFFSLLILKGIKYCCFVVSAFLAILLTIVAYALNAIFLYWMAGLMIGFINLGGQIILGTMIAVSFSNNLGA